MSTRHRRDARAALAAEGERLVVSSGLLGLADRVRAGDLDAVRRACATITDHAGRIDDPRLVTLATLVAGRIDDGRVVDARALAALAGVVVALDARLASDARRVTIARIHALAGLTARTDEIPTDDPPDDALVGSSPVDDRRVVDDLADDPPPTSAGALVLVAPALAPTLVA